MCVEMHIHSSVVPLVQDMGQLWAHLNTLLNLRIKKTGHLSGLSQH